MTLEPHHSLRLALQLTAARLGRPISPADLRVVPDADSRFGPAEAIRVAESAGLAAALGPFDPARAGSHLLPAILLCKTGEALVLTGLPSAGAPEFRLLDPAVQGADIALSPADLAARSSGFGLIFRRHPQAAPAEEAPETEGHWFFSAISQARWSYVQVALAAAVTNLLGLTTSVFTMTVYDRVLPNGAIDSLIGLTFGVTIALVFDFLIRSLRAAFVDRAGIQADRRISRTIFERLMRLRADARRGPTGALANTLREFETLREFLTSATLISIVDLPFILLFIWVIHLLAGPLALIPALAVPLVLLIGLVLQPFMARSAGQAFDEAQSRQAILIETLNGIDTIKTSGAEGLMRHRWEEAIEARSGHGARSRALAQFALNVTAFIQQGAQVVLLFWGVFLIEAGSLSMGALIAAVILTGRTLTPLGQIAQTLTRSHQARSAWKALDRLMSGPREVSRGRHGLARPPAKGGVELRNVSFSWPGQRGAALKDVSLRIAPGERVAIVGRIGSGKSTLVRLLTGLAQPDSGDILLDQTSLSQIDPDELRRDMGVLLQDVWLFSGSVRDNIAVGARAPDDAAILAAAQLSGADSFLVRHPQGYAMRLGEKGEGLSGGQRQQIALARALLGAPPLLILDEPSSALDMQGEQALVARLKAGLPGQTLIVITHRQALLELVDRVIVMDEGRIVADGPRNRLTPAAGVAALPRAANSGESYVARR